MTPDLVIVTGGGRGIGRAIALEMGKQGANVLCISKSRNCADTANSIKSIEGQGATYEMINFALDLTAVSGLIDRYARSFKRITIVLAAGSLEHRLSKSFAVNVLGNLAVVDGCLSSMKAAKFGRILFFAGGGSAYANPLFPAYSASKTALVRITENLHEELKDQGDFAVTILSPGAVETDMLAQVRAAGGEIRTPVPMEEPVNFAREFLCSENARNLSGRFVHVRDNWEPLLKGDVILSDDQWKLRRINNPIA